MRSRMPRWSAVLLATLLCQRQVDPILLRLDPSTCRCVLTARRAKCLWTHPSGFERSSWTSDSFGLSFSHPCTIIATTSAFSGVLTENCPMCWAFPSLFLLLGSAFVRSFRCVLSISVPCASFTSASVRAIDLTLVPSLSCGTISAAFHAFISWCPCFPSVQVVIHVGFFWCCCDCSYVIVSESSWARCCSSFENTSSPFDRARGSFCLPLSLRFPVHCA